MAQPQYRAKDFAQLCGISKQRVSELIADGKLNGIKIGRDMIVDIRNPLNQKWIGDRMKISSSLSNLVLNGQDGGGGFDDQDDDDGGGDDGDYLTHSQVVVLINDALKGFKTEVEFSRLGDRARHSEHVPRIVNAIRAAKNASGAEKILAKHMLVLARELYKAFDDAGRYLRHFCMCNENRWDFSVNFEDELDEYDAITATSDENLEDAPGDSTEKQAPEGAKGRTQ